MAKFNLNDYELVEDRLKKFWKDNPNGRVETEVIHITDDGSCVTVRALCYKDIEDINPVATGIAQETKGQGGFANADAWMENCETSAIGRALANWNYQGSGKKRPSKEEMSKVAKQPATKKPVVQETTTPPSKISEGALKTLVLSMCNDNKDFAMKCYKTTMQRYTMKKSVDSDIGNWSNDEINGFLDLVKDYVDKFTEEFEKRTDNTELDNNLLDVFDGANKLEQSNTDDVVVIGEDMDFSNDDWKAGKEADPMTDAQKGFLETLITQCIDNGQDALAAEAKQYINSDNTSKVTCSDMISKLKNALS
jgi:hypothetical protein